MWRCLLNSKPQVIQIPLMNRIIIQILLSIVPVLACGGCTGTYNDSPDSTADTVPLYPKREGAVRLVAYNVGAFSKTVSDSAPLIASMMKEISADVMVLNELDKNNDRHSYDQLERFAGYLGWNFFFGKAMDYRNGEYGNGEAYSKDLTVVDRFVISLPKDTGSEDRSCIVVEFSGFVFAGTHLEVRSENDRILGIRKITEELRQRYADGDKPVFLGGDMNSFPDSRTVAEILKSWNMLTPAEPTYPSDAPVNCADYIFSLKSTGSYDLSASGVCTEFHSGSTAVASDHLPVYVDIILD